MYSFELRPNSSLTPREAAWFYFSIVAVSMTVAIGFTSLGYWPILPFAGLELAVLGLAMTVCRRRGETRELIRVDENSIVVSKYFRRLGGHREAVEYEFKRPWTKVELRPGRPAHCRAGWSCRAGAAASRWVRFSPTTSDADCVPGSPRSWQAGRKTHWNRRAPGLRHDA